MKIQYILSSILLAGAVLLTSCEDKLDQTQHGVDSIDSYYKTDADAESALSSIYGAVLHVYGYQYTVKMALGDDSWTGGGGHNDGTYLLGDLTYDEAESNITGLYEYLYKVVYAANVMLANIEEDTPAKKQYCAEARVLRAYTYFDLVTLWGTPPLITEPLESGNYQQPNSTSAEIWAQIEADLTSAINSNALVEKSSIDQENGSYRVTKQFAQALLGKAYLWQKKYAEAAAMLDNVINSGKYKLYALPGSGEELENLCQEVGEDNCESIFEINWYRDITQPRIYNAPMVTWAWGVFLGWRTSDRINCSALNPVWDIHTATWGRWNPRKDLYNAFVSEEGEDGYRLRATIITLNELLDNGATYFNDLNDNEGFYQWKYRFQTKSAMSSFWCSNNFRVMRLGEVYLLAAEAYIQSGNTAKGAEYINVVRDRARVAARATGTMDELKLEKRLEMAYDATRFQDLQRWGLQEALGSWKGKQYPTVRQDYDADGKPVFRGDSQVYWTQTAGSYSAKVDLLPFPQSEMNTNPNCVQQTAWQ